MMEPIIGITVGTNSDGDHFLRRQYCTAVLRAGGIPLLLPFTGKPSAALGVCDGLLFSGGGDISPSLCGITDYDPIYLSEPSPERDEYELELAHLAYLRDIPTFGICRGIQILNVALGGTLHYHIDAHTQKRSRDQPSHRVDIVEGSLLRKLIGADSLEVNSFHHQAADIAAKSLTVSAAAEDGITEALEAADKRFFLGVQWHPEHMSGHAASVLFAALCAASQD